jgi:hypothetical protein
MSSRVVPIVMTFLGVVVVAVTQAAERGIVTGIAVEWPAYLVGGVLIVLGLLGVGRSEEAAASPPPKASEAGPIRESGRDDDEDLDEEARLRALIARIELERRQRHRSD